MNMASTVFVLVAILMLYGSIGDTVRVEAVDTREYSNSEDSSEVLDILRKLQDKMKTVEIKLDGLDNEIKLMSRIMQKKPVDGGYAPWGAWGECSQTCGNGTKSRTRECTNPPPMNKGKWCTGSDEDVSPCHIQACKTTTESPTTTKATTTTAKPTTTELTTTTEKPSTTKATTTTEKPTTTEATTKAGAFRLLIANGFWPGRDDYLDSKGLCQVVELPSSKKCQSLQSYPLRVAVSSGSVVNGSPIVCGGTTADGPGSQMFSECYTHDRSSNTWKLLTKMHTERAGHTSVVHKNALWVIGGLNEQERFLKSTEWVFLNGTVEKGPDLPEERGGHCMVDLRDGRFMIIGGLMDNPHGPPHGTTNVLIYNSYDASFTYGPSLREARAQQACTLFQSPKHNQRWVVLVVGGRHYSDEGDATSEVLDFTVPNAVWEEYVPLHLSDIPDLDDPRRVRNHGMKAVTHEKDVYLMFFRSIYQLRCFTDFCFWDRMPLKLDKVGNFGTMMVLPEEYTCQD